MSNLRIFLSAMRNTFVCTAVTWVGLFCLDADAARFAWVGSANTSTLTVSDLANAVSRGIDEKCALTYAEQQYVFYLIGADYLNNKDGTYVYSVGISVFKKALQWTAPPVSSYTVSGFRPGAPVLMQRQQLLLEAARESAAELCRQVNTKR